MLWAQLLWTAVVFGVLALILACYAAESRGGHALRRRVRTGAWLSLAIAAGSVLAAIWVG